MKKTFASSTDRRGFLRLGVLAGLGCVAGCAEEKKQAEVTTPPVQGGNRKHLEKLAKKGGSPPATKAD